MNMFKVLIMCLFSGLALTATLLTTSGTEGAATPTSITALETPKPDTLSITSQKSTQVNQIPPCDNCTELAALESIWWDESSWDLSPVKGTSFQAIYNNGDIRFKTWFRNSNKFITYRYSIVCVFRDALVGQPAHVFETFRTRQLGGTAVGGPGNTHDLDFTWNNPLVATHWDSIRAGNSPLYCTASRRFDISDLFDQLMKTVKTYGPVIAAILL